MKRGDAGCAQVPRYWRFQALRRFADGGVAPVSEDEEDDVEPELEEGCGLCGRCA